MEKKQQLDISSTKAVFLGALAPGGPTWNTLKSAFLLLGVCLAVMLGLAFSSSDSLLILHVGFLVLIAASLFSLLSWKRCLASAFSYAWSVVSILSYASPFGSCCCLQVAAAEGAKVKKIKKN